MMSIVSAPLASPVWCSCSVSGRHDNHQALESSNFNAGGVRVSRKWDTTLLRSSSCQVVGTSKANSFTQLKFGTRRQNPKAVKASAIQAPTDSAAKERNLEQVKYDLLSVANDTGRGLNATADQRAMIEEAMVAVEKFDAGKPLQLDELDGTWLLQYTTARDVVGILEAAQTPFIQVGQIFQKFKCRGRVDGGSVKNVVRFSVPGILQENDGGTFVVDASFSVTSPRSIALKFEEAKLGDILISEELQGFLAPAVLPRSFFTLQILQFLRTLAVTVPLARPTLPEGGDPTRVPIGLRYYLTYLDRDILLGRAVGNGGVFIFSRTQRLKLF